MPEIIHLLVFSRWLVQLLLSAARFYLSIVSTFTDVNHPLIFITNVFLETTVTTPQCQHQQIFTLFSWTSLPDIKDSSTKLMICSKAFNALVVSSLHLDVKTNPELGPATLKFSPSKRTKLCLSSRSLNSVNKILASKQTVFDDHNSDANIHQLRSKFTHPHTNLTARKGHDTIGTMPFIVFTLLDAFNHGYDTDARIGSKLLVAVADAVRWNFGVLLKSSIVDIIAYKSLEVKFWNRY